FMPWYTSSASFMGVNARSSMNGFTGNGILVFIAFAACIGACFMDDKTKPFTNTSKWVVLCSGAVALLTAFGMAGKTARGSTDFAFASARMDGGFSLAVIAAIFMIIVSLVYKSITDMG